MPYPTPPSRKELERFLPDQRSVRAFEKLFALFPGEVTSQIEQALIGAGSALSRSQEAIDAISRIADAVDLLAKQPPPREHTFLKGDYIDFPVNGPHVQRERRLQWNDDDGTLDVGLYGDSVLQVGQESMYYAKNTSGAQIDNGTPVMFTGTVGASGKLTFGPAVSDGTYPASYMMGVATQDIAKNEFGYVTAFGLVRGFDTSGTPYGETWVDGDILYFDPSTPGGWTKTQPSAPAVRNPLAVVVNAATGGAGSIFVRYETDQSQSGGGGSLALAITTKTANYTATIADYTILCDASGGGFTVTLPNVSTASGYSFNIKKIDGSGAAVVISPAGSETIDGSTSITMTTPNLTITVQSDGSNWYIL